MATILGKISIEGGPLQDFLAETFDAPPPQLPVDPGYSPPWARPPVDPGYSPPWARPPVDPGYSPPWARPPVDPGYSPPWAQPIPPHPSHPIVIPPEKPPVEPPVDGHWHWMWFDPPGVWALVPPQPGKPQPIP